MSLDHFWGTAFVKMASKTAKKTQEKRSNAAGNMEKAQDGGAETEETEVLSPAITKAMAFTFMTNISKVVEAKFDSE